MIGNEVTSIHIITTSTSGAEACFRFLKGNGFLCAKNNPISSGAIYYYGVAVSKNIFESCARQGKKYA